MSTHVSLYDQLAVGVPRLVDTVRWNTGPCDGDAERSGSDGLVVTCSHTDILAGVCRRQAAQCQLRPAPCLTDLPLVLPQQLTILHPCQLDVAVAVGMAGQYGRTTRTLDQRPTAVHDPGSHRQLVYTVTRQAQLEICSVSVAYV